MTWPVTEGELGTALDRLDVLQARARENLALQGREASAACVLLEHWREDLSARRIWPARFRQVLAELERRDLVLVEGPFAVLVDPRRSGKRSGTSAGLHSLAGNRTSGASA